jgi:hypothetical protein
MVAVAEARRRKHRFSVDAVHRKGDTLVPVGSTEDASRPVRDVLG